MKIIPINEADLRSSVFNLQSAVFIYPTDTCYGVGCAISKKDLLEKVYQIKGRAFTKPVSIMVASHEELWKYGKHSPLAEKIARQFLPGDVTLLLERTEQLPNFLNPDSTHVGLRIIKNDFCDRLLEAVGEPIVTTSANPAGEPELYDAQSVQTAFADKKDLVDIVFDGGVLPKNPPSTIIKITAENFEIIREGRVAEEIIRKASN